jgi:hypothetical protein
MEEKLPRRLKIELLRVHEDPVVVPEYRLDHGVAILNSPSAPDRNPLFPESFARDTASMNEDGRLCYWRPSFTTVSHHVSQGEDQSLPYFER